MNAGTARPSLMPRKSNHACAYWWVKSGAQWMKVGPDMGQKIIALPKADLYKLQFRLEYRDGQVASNEVPYTATFVENGKPAALTLPHRQEYKLYRVVGGATSSGVAAIVKYELTNDGR